MEIIDIISIAVVNLAITAGLVYFLIYKQMRAILSKGMAGIASFGAGRPAKEARQKANQVLGDLTEGYVENDPTLRLVRDSIESLTGYTIDGETLLALSQNPMVQNLIKQFAGPLLSQLQPKNPILPEPEKSYQFRGGL